MDNVIFQFKRGRTYSRYFTITEYTDKVDKMLFTVCENEEDKNYKIRKTLDDGITIIDEGTDEKGVYYRTYNLFIKATDTDKLKIGKEYVFDITLYTGSIKLPVINGIMILEGTSTKTCNE